jgi:hypothetical protein
MHICIFWVGDGTFVSFGLRQRKKTLLKGMWEREKLEKKKKKTREMREREKIKNKKIREERACGGGGGLVCGGWRRDLLVREKSN